jgi:hypothetical protein
MESYSMLFEGPQDRRTAEATANLPCQEKNMKTVFGVHPNRKRYTFASAGVLLLIAMPGWAVTPVEVAKLVADDGATNDFFGFSVALSGDTAVIGVLRDDDNGNDSGSAYVFTRSGTTWSQQAKLTATDGAANDTFGGNVAISGDTAVIGSLGDDADVNGVDSGSAYVFTRSGTSWSEQAKLTAADGAAGDEFGYSVAILGDTAVIGAARDDDKGNDSGSAYVFTRSGTSWSQQAKLTATDGAANDRFGTRVALSGSTAVIGAILDDDNSDNSGSAYVFTQSGTTWSQQAKLTAADSATDDVFGWSVALSGDTVVIGAPTSILVLPGGTGSAYVFDINRDDIIDEDPGNLVAVEIPNN